MRQIRHKRKTAFGGHFSNSYFWDLNLERERLDPEYFKQRYREHKNINDYNPYKKNKLMYDYVRQYNHFRSVQNDINNLHRLRHVNYKLPIIFPVNFQNHVIKNKNSFCHYFFHKTNQMTISSTPFHLIPPSFIF